MGIPAVVTAGDGRAAKAVYGESKVYLELEATPLVALVVLTLQDVEAVDSVWVVGDRQRLDAVFARRDICTRLTKPLHVVAQRRNLLENCWEAYRCALAGAGPGGRDPECESDLDQEVLYLSGDLPFATAAEISEFIGRARATHSEYALGVVTDRALRAFKPEKPGEPGIEMAYFNLREGRLRQSNLHLARPARIGNRHYIEEMYEHRHQRQLGNMLALAWRILRSEQGGLMALFLYGLMHAAGVADRLGMRRAADWIGNRVPLSVVERVVGRLLRTRFRFVFTEAGGSALDIDTEHDYDVARMRFREWLVAQRARAEDLYGKRAGATARVSAAARETAHARA
ncbi:MAG: NTP transferase domain-containing protein [Proteobacteria bacterium]|nr:NTP transferase domain-containing protein [Pseudomonadota bacterium]